MNPFSKLPRDTRDTLFMLLVIVWVVLPQVNELPLWCSLLGALIVIWRGTLAWRGRPLPSKWWLLGTLALSMGLNLLTYKTLLGREAGVSFVVALLALKTMELRARRDAFVVFFLSFFLMLTNFFHSQSLLTAAAMLIALLGLLTALVNAHMPVGKPPLWYAAKVAGGMALLGAPIMLILFVLFPRVAPLWGLPGDAMNGRSGLSMSMTVGNIATLALDDSVAMRVQFNKTVPHQSALYFRGPVLSFFNGRTWQMQAIGQPYLARLSANLQVSEPSIHYQVTLEPNRRPWLLVLDATPDAPILNDLNTQYNAHMTRELQWVLDKPVTELLRYQVQSYPRFMHGPRVPVVGLQAFLELPDGFNPRTLQMATQWLKNPQYAGFTSAQWADLVMAHLRTDGYHYTLDPGLFGQHSADEFWFDRKAGFCEHIASGFVILMRALGVPSRIVTGYQGGEKNAIDGMWTVRQSDAHAWTEIWQAGLGWVRVDPTSAVAPERIGNLQRLMAPHGVVTGAILGYVSPEFSNNLRAVWEAINTHWNQWVLDYSQNRQLDLLKRLGFNAPNWHNLIVVLCAIMVMTSVGGVAWMTAQRQHQDPWLRLLEKAAKQLHQSGVTLSPNSTPRQMAQQLGQHMNQKMVNTTAIKDWLTRLEALRYAEVNTAHKTPQQQLQQLRREWVTSGLSWCQQAAKQG